MEIQKMQKNTLEIELSQEKLNLLTTDKLNVRSSDGTFLGKMTLAEMMKMAQETNENAN